MKRNRMTTVALTLLFAVASFGLFGCSKKDTPPPPPAPKAETKPPVVQQPISSAKFAMQSPPAVDFAAMKDPFKPYVAVAVGLAAPKKNRFGQIIPILSFDLTQFSVKGIIIGLKENTALIVDPTGKPYVVKRGMEIGRNEGKITKITPTYIEVFEQYRDEAGKLKKNITKLMLPKKE
ncbi:MAG: pilus assembly protein PilP [Geobacteraceae bacterium]